MKKQFAIDTTKIVLAELLTKSKKVKTELEYDKLTEKYAKTLVDLLHISVVVESEAAVCRDVNITTKEDCKIEHCCYKCNRFY